MDLSDFFDEEEKRRLESLKPLTPWTPEQLADYERRQAEFAKRMEEQPEEESEDEDTEED